VTLLDKSIQNIKMSKFSKDTVIKTAMQQQWNHVSDDDFNVIWETGLENVSTL
jgi:hypothetical protein